MLVKLPGSSTCFRVSNNNGLYVEVVFLKQLTFLDISCQLSHRFIQETVLVMSTIQMYLMFNQ
jgi:hypothetical protein